MNYQNITQGIFIARPNRFIAHVQLNDTIEICHVKNTGRCKELLIPGVTVYLEKSSNPNRKTKYDLIGVMKGSRLINMDSQIPNAAAAQWIAQGNLFEDVTLIKREKTYGNSRFDLYLETPREKIFMEIKGVTLEVDNQARFPDAPTLRGIKHIQELCRCTQDGYEAYILFVIQMEGVSSFAPNQTTQPAFADALCEAKKAGVHILAYDCKVTADSIALHTPVPVILPR